MTKKEWIQLIEKIKNSALLNEHRSGICTTIYEYYDAILDYKVSYMDMEFLSLNRYNLVDLFIYLMDFKAGHTYWFPLDKKHVKIRRQMLDHFRDTVIELGWYKFIPKN